MSEPTRTAITAAAIVILLAVLSPFLMMGGMMMGPGMMGGWGGVVSPWPGMLVSFFWLLILAGIGLVAVWGFRRMSSGEAGSIRQPLDILKERYARGEVTREQFEQVRKDLE